MVVKPVFIQTDSRMEMDYCFSSTLLLFFFFTTTTVSSRLLVFILCDRDSQSKARRSLLRVKVGKTHADSPDFHSGSHNANVEGLTCNYRNIFPVRHKYVNNLHVNISNISFKEMNSIYELTSKP